MEQPNCEICERPLSVQWSDTHGVAACITCGLPYRVYHYEEDEGGKQRRVEKPPTVAIKPEWVPIGRRYWQETGRRTFPAAFDFGVLPSRERSYSGATEGDIEKFNEWLDAHSDELPKAPEPQP